MPTETTLHGLDHLRMTGPGLVLDELVAWACRRWGAAFDDQKGFTFYTNAMTWPGGAKVLYGHKSGGVMVQLDGAVLSSESPDERVVMLRELRALGLKATRVDAAIDRTGEGITLIEDAIEACKRGELCGARSFEPVHGYGTRGLYNHGLKIGKRGSDGSGRYVRIYDKGLEQRYQAEKLGEEVTADDVRLRYKAGQLVRFEVEFSDDCAEQFVEAVLVADGVRVTWQQQVQAMVLGAVDFREGQHNTTLARRSQASWWAAVVASVSTVCVRAFRRALPALSSVRRWIASQVAPTLHAFAAAAGREVSEVCDEFVANVRVSAEAVCSAMVRPATVEYQARHLRA